MSYKPELGYTENPFIDLLLYNLKILTYGSVIKDESTANKNETITSLKNSDIYIACINNTADLGIFSNISSSILTQAGMTDSQIKLYSQMNYSINYIPDNLKSTVLTLCIENFINTYVEENDYYRMITGLPPIGDDGIPIRDYEYLFPSGITIDPFLIYIHELDTATCITLENSGVFDVIKTDYPNAKYIDYLICGISIYKARTYNDLDLLYIPDTADSSIIDEFKIVYNKCKKYTVKCVYTSGMEITSTYYKSFLITLILLMTMIDMIVDIQSHIIKKDILNRRCIEFIFSMFGIPYYQIIPEKYQERICKNIYSIIKYKSSTTEMINLENLFGFDNISINKYYLVKYRKLDAWGDFQYNYTSELTGGYNDIIDHESYNETITDNSNLTRNITFPFDYFIQKGNIVIVSDNKKVLRENIDYTIINGNQIQFTSGVLSINDIITYDFYYDISTKDSTFQVDTTKAVKIYSYSFTPTDNTVTFPISNSNIPSYVYTGNQFIVSVGSLFLPQQEYTIDSINQTITISSDITIINRTVTVIAIYSPSMNSIFCINKVTANHDNQTIFVIPEPFDNYINGGSYFIPSLGGLFIDQSRYTITAGNTVGTSLLTFIDGTQVSNGRSLTFNFIYSSLATSHSLQLLTQTVSITATQHYQTIFEPNFPVNNYTECGYKVFVQLRGWWLPLELFSTANNKIQILDQSISLQPGEVLKLVMVYCPIDRTQSSNSSIIISTDFRTSPTDSQNPRVFSITFPTDGYNAKGNKLIIDADGRYIEEGVDCSVDYTNNLVTITNDRLVPINGKKLNYTFIYNIEYEYDLKITPYNIPITSLNQNTFTLELPFYPYSETGQGFLVLSGSTLITPDRITMINDYTFTIDGFKVTELNSNRYLTVLFIYNNYYILSGSQKLIVEWKDAGSLSNISNIDIPVPFNNYIENNWDYFVTYNNRMIMDTNNYDVYNNTFYTNPPSNIDNGTYSSITFVFIYLIKYPYVYNKISEDYENDIDLKFCKIPISSLYSGNYLKDKSNYVDYDTITLKDGWWDGTNYQQDSHQKIKDQIYQLKFNYIRTKYYTLNQTLDIGEMSTQIPYFYNILFDNVFLEDNLKITIPSISASRQFKLSNIFIYMISLTYAYYGNNDPILSQPSDIMYIKGFNFNASLDDLKKYIMQAYGNINDFPIWNFNIPSSQIQDIPTLIDIYQTDINLREVIINGMINAKDYNTYKIWKYIYDTLLIIKLNMNFFKLSNGKIADTFTDFLKEKDPILYTSLVNIRSIKDNNSKEDTIVALYSDIIYVLDKYISSKDFQYIYEQFPGLSSSYAMDCLMLLLNFFKSYKIEFLSKTTVLQFGVDSSSKYENNIKAYDQLYITENLDKKDYYPYTDDLKINEYLLLEETDNWARDNITINERLIYGVYRSEIFGGVTLVETNYNDIPGYVQLAISSKNDLNGEVNLETPNIYTISGSTSISGINIYSDMNSTIRAIENMDGKADIFGNAVINYSQNNSDLVSSASTTAINNNKDIPAEFEYEQSQNNTGLNGSVDFVTSINKDTDSSLTVQANNMVDTLFNLNVYRLVNNSDLSGYVINSVNGNYVIEGNTTIESEMLTKNINGLVNYGGPGINSIISGNLSINGININKDLQSVINISEGGISSNIYGDATISQGKMFKDISGSMIYEYMETYYQKELNSTINVNPGGKGIPILGYVSLPNRESDSYISGSTTLPNNELDSYIYGNTNIDSVTKDILLNGSADIDNNTLNNDLSSSANLETPTINSFNGSVDFYAGQNTDLTGTMIYENQYSNDLISTINVQILYNNYLNSSANLETPNIYTFSGTSSIQNQLFNYDTRGKVLFVVPTNNDISGSVTLL